MEPLRSVAVLGLGGVGGFLAAVLAQRGVRTTCVVREDRLSEYTKTGLRLESVSFGSFTAHPRFVTRLDESCDLILIATKSFALSDAIKRVPTQLQQKALIMPLLNGWEHLEFLKNIFGAQRVVMAAISIEAYKRDLCTVVHSTTFGKILAVSDHPKTRLRLVAVAGELSKHGIPTSLGASETAVAWDKLVRLNALACTTTLAEESIGMVRASEKWRPVLIGCIEEGVRVAQALGLNMTVEGVLKRLDELNPAQRSSMSRDLVTGRRTEINVIGGAILREGRRHGIECPTIEACVRDIESKERR